MKKLLLTLLLLPVLGYCDSSLDLSIAAIKQQYELQLSLREEIVQYEKLKDQYLKTPEDKELLSRLALRAERVQEMLRRTHLAHLFSPEFIKELNLFSRFAKK